MDDHTTISTFQLFKGCHVYKSPTNRGPTGHDRKSEPPEGAMPSTLSTPEEPANAVLPDR